MNNLEKYIADQKNKTVLNITSSFGSMKAIGDRLLEVVGVPFGGHLDGKDADGQFFSENTEIMMDIGDERPVTYYHGLTPWGTQAIMPEVLGKAKLTGKDERGWIFEIKLFDDKTAEEKGVLNSVKRIWESAKQGLAKVSSGSISYLIRLNKATGEILNWALGEIGIIDTGQGRQPTNQLATVDLKSLYVNAGIEMPKAFIKTGEVEIKAAQEDESESKFKIIKRYIIKR